MRIMVLSMGSLQAPLCMLHAAQAFLQVSYQETFALLNLMVIRYVYHVCEVTVKK